MEILLILHALVFDKLNVSAYLKPFAKALRVKQWQAEIKKGDYYMQETKYGFNIYGEVLKNAYRQRNLKNYRFVKAYSLACSDGEPGDVHVSVITQIITKEQFEEARKNGWR